MWNSKLAYNVLLDELGKVACINLSVRLNFRQLSEIISSYEQKFSLSHGQR